MKFPQMDEYHGAVQHPETFFQDPELRRAAVEKDTWGLPRVRSGNFALTYQLRGATGKAWAVRCFIKDISCRQQRYAAISQFLARCQAPFFISTDYLSAGILVNGTWFPITKMSWVNGETLLRFVERNLENLSTIRALGDRFQSMTAALESLGVAHGDLQHGNILVTGDRLILVDYDGMYVPALAGLHAEERGHVNYQHPQRNAEFGPEIDRFSAIAIYLALKAITPPLWNKYGTGENLLFSQDDFRSPDTSELFADLETFPELRKLIQRFRLVCKNRLVSVPRLADFLRGDIPASVSEPITLSARRSQYKTLDATKREELFANVGRRITVIGKITEHSLKQTRTDPPKRYILLSFGDWQKGSFRLILWSEVLELFELQQKKTADYSQRWVSVTGLLGKFTKEQRTHPQIIIEAPSEIELLDGEEEAKRRLALSVEPEIELGLPAGPVLVDQIISKQVGQPVKAHAVPLVSATADKISDLYKNWIGPTSPTQAKVTPTLPSATVPPKIVLQPILPSPANPCQPVQNQVVAATRKLEACPHCGAQVRTDRMEAHIEKKCPALKDRLWQSNHPQPTQLSSMASTKNSNVEVCPRCGGSVSSEYLPYHMKKSCPMLKRKGA